MFDVLVQKLKSLLSDFDKQLAIDSKAVSSRAKTRTAPSFACVPKPISDKRWMAFYGFEKDRATLKYRCPASDSRNTPSVG